MGVFAQHGFRCGDKIRNAFSCGCLDGVVFSPKDVKLTSLKEKINDIKNVTDTENILFDPQFYAAILANEPNAKLGSLPIDYADIFSVKNLVNLSRDRYVEDEINKSGLFQKNELGLSKYILPNVCIQEDFNSLSAVIARNFIEIGDEIARSKNVSSSVYHSLVIEGSCFRKTDNLLKFINGLTQNELMAKGFYILVESSKTDGRCPWCDKDVLANQLYLAYVLSQNGYETIFGYSFLSSPYLWAVGANSCAFGWFDTLRFLSLRDKFIDSGKKGGRNASRKYFAGKIWRPVEISVLETGKDFILNGLSIDNLFLDRKNPPSESDEILQYWETLRLEEAAIKKYEYTEDRLEYIKERLREMESFVNDKTNVLHSLPIGGKLKSEINQCKQALKTFTDLSEIPFSF